MMQRALSLFSVASLVAAIVTLSGYLFSRNTSFAAFFDRRWEMILLATGVLILGLLVIGAGIRLFYSVDGAFMPLVVIVSLALVGIGAFLLYLGVGVIVDMAVGATTAPGAAVGFVRTR